MSQILVKSSTHFADILSQKYVDYLAISETKLDCSFPCAQFAVQDFTIHRQDLTSSSSVFVLYAMGMLILFLMNWLYICLSMLCLTSCNDVLLMSCDKTTNHVRYALEDYTLMLPMWMSCNKTTKYGGYPYANLHGSFCVCNIISHWLGTYTKWSLT